MGCGKSSVGRELSGLLSLPFVDLDEYIESREGRSIRDIFESEGEPAFRKMELDALKAILSQATASEPGYENNMILALGGGTLTTPECAELVSAHTFCIYLKASPATLLAHLEQESATRPMLTAPNNSPEVTKQQLHRRITALLSQREPIYEATASHTISTDGLSIPQIAAAISKLPNE